MFYISFSVLKHLYRRSASNLTKAKNFHIKTSLQGKPRAMRSEFTADLALKHSDLVNITKLLNSYKEPEAVNWGELLEKLTEINVPEPEISIVATCLKLGKIDYGMSYFKYVVEKEEDFTSNGIIYFSKLLLRNTNATPQHEEVVKVFYEKVKDYLFSSPFIKSQALEGFLRFPSCFWDSVENLKGVRANGNQAIINRAFEMDEPEVGWRFIQDNKFECSNKFLRIYMGYCTRRALEGKFSVNLINDLVDVCAKNMLVFNTNNLDFEMAQLINALELNKNDYTLSLEKCTLSSDNVCSNCGMKLKDTPLTESEFETVKTSFFDTVFCNKDLFIHSSEKEVEDFKAFLENCDPYNMVFDGLNLLYRGKGIGVKFYNQYLKHFLDRNFKILVIGRKHSAALLTKGPFLSREMYKKNFQIFLTSNVTDDDLFTLYSALHGGPGTFFFSGDYLSPYSGHFTDEKKILFMKWKISHQYLMYETSTMVPPWPHMGLPQLTFKPTKEGDCHIWHISHSLGIGHLSRAQKLNWACLKAIPRGKET